jgi:hypothetical protein
MNSSWLVEIASIWAYHASSRGDEHCLLPVEAVHEYWLKNRVRFDGWNAMMTAQLKRLKSPSTLVRARAWNRLTRIIEDVLLAEPLARVTVAIAAGLEAKQIDHDSHAILHNVYMSHVEIRHRCLKAIAEGLERGNDEAIELNNLRSYLEHWTDMLLGYFSRDVDSLQYSHEARRVREFAREYGERQLGHQSKMIWSLLIASCRAWLAKHVSNRPISPEINQHICETALGMIHPDLFDGMGLHRTHLIQRIERGIDQANATLTRLEDGTWETMSSVITQRSAIATNRVH